ncbi:MAG TPA: arginine deiminase family protein [Pyrinomonadaceae bacterium]|nr:arginine deiminase family protein [Pyrinomonadaceae bacterium]
MFTKAIVRAPSANFASGLTTVDLGAPVFELALQQHEAYCRTLEACGLSLDFLEPDERYPDSTFVEDTAVLTRRGAVIARPGVSSRLGETEAIERVLGYYFDRLHAIREPGTLDGGDVCEAGDHFFIGISQRTNEAGATQLATLLEEFGYTSTLIDIRNLSNILHLKSGLAYLGGNRVLVVDEVKNLESFAGYDLIRIRPEEAYAANCLLIDDRVLVASGFPVLEQQLRETGYKTVVLEMSEFQKMDGGLSCLSLRF